MQVNFEKLGCDYRLRHGAFMANSAESSDQKDNDQPLMQLGEIGLNAYAPYLMNRIMGRYNANLRKQLISLGLTTPKMRALAILSVVDGLLISKLCVYAVVEQSTLSRALDSLEADALVRRETDAEDQRASRIYITRAGREVFDKLWPDMEASYREMFVGISDAEQAAFVATLQKILVNVREHNF